MSGECLEILVHIFHQKPHHVLHKPNLEIKTQRKKNLKKQVNDYIHTSHPKDRVLDAHGKL